MDTLGLAPVRAAQRWPQRIFWNALEDLADAQDAARHGYFACLLICVSTLLIMMLDGSFLGGLLDVVFYGMAGLGIRQLSRLAAVAAFLFFLVERAVALMAGHIGFLGVAGLLIAAILLNAVRAVYAARELRPEGGLDRLASSPLTPEWPNWMTWLETLPPLLWPKLQIAFKFYMVGMIAMMLVGVLVRYVGLMQ